MTRVATPKSEADLVAVAFHGTASHVDRIVAGFCNVKRNVDPERGRMQLRRRGVWCNTAEDGTATLTVRGDPAAIAAILRRIDAAAEKLPELVDEPDAPQRRSESTLWSTSPRVFLEPDEHAAPNEEIADTIIPNLGAGERLDLDHAFQALWYLDPPKFN